MARSRTFLTTALLAAALAAPAPAHADIEMEYLECRGTVVPGTLSNSQVNSGSNFMTCWHTHHGTEWLPTEPDLWYAGPVTSSVHNTPLAPGIYDTSGSFRFVSGGEEWGVWFADRTVDDVMTFRQTEYDRVVQVGGSPFPYHIQAGTLTDTSACEPSEVDTCVLGESHEFWFVAEYVHDLPV